MDPVSAEARRDRVEELRSQVSAGVYHVSAELVAEAIMRHRRSVDESLFLLSEPTESDDSHKRN